MSDFSRVLDAVKNYDTELLHSHIRKDNLNSFTKEQLDLLTERANIQYEKNCTKHKAINMISYLRSLGLDVIYTGYNPKFEDDFTSSLLLDAKVYDEVIASFSIQKSDHEFFKNES